MSFVAGAPEAPTDFVGLGDTSMAGADVVAIVLTECARLDPDLCPNRDTIHGLVLQLYEYVATYMPESPCAARNSYSRKDTISIT